MTSTTRSRLAVVLAVLAVCAPLAPAAAGLGSAAATDADRSLGLDGRADNGIFVGEIEPGGYVETTVTVSPNDESWDVSDVYVAGTDGDAFAVVDGGGSFTLEPGEERAITISFSAEELGAKNATLVIDEQDARIETALSGEVVESTDGGGDNEPVFTNVSFGNVSVGESATATVTVPNNLDQPLDVTASLIGPDADQFRIVDGGGTFTIPAEGTHDVDVAFEPDVAGSATAQIRFDPVNDSRPEAYVDLSGRGVDPSGPVVSLSTTSLSFDQVAIGDGRNRTVTVTNEANQSLLIGVTTISRPFTAVDDDAVEVAPGESRELTVRFEPTSSGTVDGSVVVSAVGGDVATERTVSLTGTGIDPQIEVTVADDRLTADDPTTTVTVANRGEGPLTVDELTIAGPFSVDASTPLTVPAGESRELTLRFDADAGENVTSTLRIESNDPDDPVVSRRVRGVSGEANATLDVEGDVDDEEQRVNATVTDVADDSTVRVDTSTGVNTSERVGVQEIAIAVDEGEPFTLNLTAGDGPLSSSPTFDRGNATFDVGYLSVNHSTPDANIESVQFTFTVPDERLRTNETTGDLEPNDTTLYRFVDGRWVELNTVPVEEVPGGWKFRATAPGLSEFAIGRNEPRLSISDTEINVTTTRVGDSVAVRVLITNTGSATGLYEVELFENGQRVSSKRPTVRANSTVLISFLRSYEEAGEYRIEVNNRTVDTVSVQPPNETTTQPGTTTAGGDGGTTTKPKEGDPTNPGGPPVIPLLIAGLLVTVGVGAVYRRLNGDGGDGDASGGPGGDPDGSAGGTPPADAAGETTPPADGDAPVDRTPDGDGEWSEFSGWAGEAGVTDDAGGHGPDGADDAGGGASERTDAADEGPVEDAAGEESGEPRSDPDAADDADGDADADAPPGADDGGPDDGDASGEAHDGATEPEGGDDGGDGDGER